MGGGGKGKGGGGGSSINVQPSPYEQEMANIAKDYYNQTAQARQYLLQDFSSFLRPAGFTNQGTYGASTATPTPANLYTNAVSTVPTAGEISDQLRVLYGGYANSPNASQYFSNLGVDMAPYLQGSGGLSNLPTVGSEEWGPWAQTTANAIRSDLMDKAMSNAIAGSSAAGSTAATAPSGFTSSNLYNPYNLPGYAPLYQLARTGLESQYGQARENIMASSPRGGGLAENLANLEMSRAQQAGSLPATIAAPLIQDIYNKAYGVAFGAPQTTLSGLGGAASSYNQLYGTQAAYQSAQATQAQQAGLAGAAGLGSLVGLGVKAAMK